MIAAEVATYADVTIVADPARGLLARRDGRTVVLKVRAPGQVRDLDLGPGADGAPVAVYARCAPSCDIYMYDLTRRREAKVAAASRPGISERLPSLWRGTLIFERGRDVLSATLGSAAPARVLLRQTYGLDDLELGPTAVAISGSFDTDDGDTQTEVDVISRAEAGRGRWTQLDQAFVGEGSAAGFGGITAAADGTFFWQRASRNGCAAVKRVVRRGGPRVRAHAVPAAAAPLAARSADPAIPQTPESEGCGG